MEGVLPEYLSYRDFEEEVNVWDNIFHDMKLENCPVLRSNQKVGLTIR